MEANLDKSFSQLEAVANKNKCCILEIQGSWKLVALD